MSTFVGASTFLRSALGVTILTNQFNIAQIGLFFRAIFFYHLDGLTKQIDKH